MLFSNDCAIETGIKNVYDEYMEKLFSNRENKIKREGEIL